MKADFFFTVNFLCWTYFDKVGVDYGQLVFAASKVQFRICGFDSTKQVWFADFYKIIFFQIVKFTQLIQWLDRMIFQNSIWALNLIWHRKVESVLVDM